MPSRLSPVVDAQPAARVIDIAPQPIQKASLPAPNGKILAYTRPAQPGQAPQLWMTTQPAGQLVDITA